jgi:NADH:ubiquinone oxidoreductase subunit E
MKITICIGSSCHLKGSKQVVEQLQQMITENNLEDKIILTGTFCMGNCRSGVNVTIDEENFSVSSDTVKTFFEEQVLNRLK